MHKQLVIIGAGGFSQEVICWAEHAHSADQLPPIKGYLLDSRYELLPAEYGIPWLGDIDGYTPELGDACLLAIGEISAKKNIVSRLKARGAKFATLIHPTAIVTRTAKLGEGCILCPYATVSAGVTLGDFVGLNGYSGIGHGSSVGAYTTISSHVDITGNVTVGEGVFVGSGARVLPNLQVGNGAKVGAGSIVMRSVKPGVTVVAAPAKKLF